MTVVLEFDLADRLHKTLRETGIGTQEMADQLGVSRTTVSAWVNGRNRPRRSALAMWSAVTGYPLEWLETGQMGGAGPRFAYVDDQGNVVHYPEFVHPPGLEPGTRCFGGFASDQRLYVLAA